ncbi:hypothetical protein ACROYT_G002852 [Oculina patagonica]
MSKKSDGRQTVRDDQNQQEGKHSVTEKRQTTGSGEDPALTVATTTICLKPQQNTEVQGGTWSRKSDNQQQEFARSQKSKKNQKKDGKGSSSVKQKSSATQPTPNLQQIEPEAGVTVVFHVLLAVNFKMTDERLFIRAHGPDLGDFKLNCVDMSAVEIDKSQDKKELVRFRGELTISLDRAHWGTGYKYVVIGKGKPQYEELLGQNGMVNRSLKIPEEHIEPGATWNQYDGVAYVFYIFSKVSGFFVTNQVAAKDRSKALLSFLPKWSGFLVNESNEKMNATEALLKLRNVVRCLSKDWVEEKGNHRQSQPANFDVKKVI